MSRALPVLYIDLDGTIRHGKDQLGRFVNGPGDVVVFPEVPDILAAYKAAGWRIAAVSNQGGVSLGIMSADDCAAAMRETHRQCRELFDRITFCIHHPGAQDPEFAVCWCRKPRAGLVFEAARSMAQQYGEIYPPHLGLFVGDRPEDKGCADSAALEFMDAAEWRDGGWGEALRRWEAKRQ